MPGRDATAVLIASILLLACNNRCPETYEWAPSAVIADNLAAMRQAARNFRADKGRWPRRLEELVPDYIRRIPVDPITGTARTWVYRPDAGDTPPIIKSGAAGTNCDGIAYASL